MKIFILIITILVSSNYTFSSNVLSINGKNIEILKTRNIVFNIVYKDFIKNYEKDFLILKESIENNNNKRDKSIDFIYVKAAEKLKNYQYSENLKISDQMNAAISDYAYDIKRVSKIKFDYQEKEVDLFLNNQLINYRNLLKNTLNDYEINEEEKKFINQKSKKIALIINAEIERNNNYSKNKMIELAENLSFYESINQKYISDLNLMNRNIDREIFNELWPSMKSIYSFPSQEQEQ